jgi:hypothetical protein
MASSFVRRFSHIYAADSAYTGGLLLGLGLLAATAGTWARVPA